MKNIKLLSIKFLAMPFYFLRLFIKNITFWSATIGSTLVTIDYERLSVLIVDGKWQCMIKGVWYMDISQTDV